MKLDGNFKTAFNSFNCDYTQQNPSQSKFSRQYLLSLLFFIFVWIKARILYYTNNWIYTTNHRRIAVNYFWFVILAGIVGMVLATAIRLEFAYPGVGIFAGDSLQYLTIASAHGVIMVFFMIMPLLFGAFGNFLLPTQLGVHDVAFPRLNSAAFWFLPGGLIMLAQMVCIDRRYQRMNCFNIREAQALLKKRFFVDLVSEHDYKTIFDKTLISLKYKVNGIVTDKPNVHIFFKNGLKALDVYRMEQYITSKRMLRSDSFNFKKTPWFNFFVEYHMLSNLSNYFIQFQLSTYTSFVNVNLLYIQFIIWQYFSHQRLRFYYFRRRTKTYIRDLLWVPTPKKKKINIIDQLLNGIYDEEPVQTTFSDKIKMYSQDLGLILYQKLDQAAEKWHPYFNDQANRLEAFLNKIIDISIATYNYCRGTWWIIAFINDPTIFAPFKRLSDKYDFILLFFIASSDWQDFSTLSMLDCNEPNPPFLWKFVRKTPIIKYLFLTNNNYIDTPWYNFQLFFYCLSYIPYFCYLMAKNFYNFEFWVYYTDRISNMITDWMIPSYLDTDLLNGDVWDVIKIGNNIFLFENPRNVAAFFAAMFKVFCAWVLEEMFAIYKYIVVDLGIWFSMYSAIRFCWINFMYICIKILKIIFKIIRFFLRILTWFTDWLFFYGWILTKYLFFLILRVMQSPFKFFINIITPSPIIYDAEYFNKFRMFEFYTIHNNELSFINRYHRTINPIFKYDYKSGDYFPKLYKELYTYLYTTVNDLTGGLRTSPWFFSFNFLEFYLTHFNDFFINSNLIQLSQYENTRRVLRGFIKHSDSFFNLFYTHSHIDLSVNKHWTSLSSLNQKFYHMFCTSSMQQRIHANWKQLKFTREAWRCKLLAARHQRTLYKRYVHEDGIFWSIERNAKDLLPGWAMITPFSSRTRFTAVGKVDIGLMGVLLVLNSSIISGANFLVTYRYLSTLNNRKMRDARAFFTEGVLVASWMMIAANPMLIIGIIMLLSDRHWQTSFFDYSGGGDTVLFQHMFWFFGHPEVYVIMIPIFGFTNTMLSYYLRKRVSARASLMYSMYTIAFLGFFVWGHHMYMVGLAHTTRMLFSTLTVMISVPAATKLMHWCVTMVNSTFVFELPFLFILTFIFFFVSGGISGMCVAHTGMDILFHDTFYVIGHFHVMLAGGAMFGSFGAFYFYFPSIFGVKYSRFYAYLHYSYYVLGQFLTVVPMFWLGYAGMPRRVLDYPASMGGWHSLVSAGHLLSVAGLIAFFLMIFESLRQAKPAIRNTFGINRYNTCLNFYLYAISRIRFVQQKSLSFNRTIRSFRRRLKIYKKTHIQNLEPLETTIFYYEFK